MVYFGAEANREKILVERKFYICRTVGFHHAIRRADSLECGRACELAALAVHQAIQRYIDAAQFSGLDAAVCHMFDVADDSIFYGHILEVKPGAIECWESDARTEALLEMAFSKAFTLRVPSAFSTISNEGESIERATTLGVLKYSEQIAI